MTLSGCDGTEGGTIDYIDGHWVFTSAQTEQHTDITQLLASPDAFYGAASAMADEELQRSFDQLSPGQCAQIFSALGEHRAMALASRLTQTQVERLLAALQGQSEIPTKPAALAAVWQTLTTEEQLSALGGLSSADYAALWALLDSATPSPVPDAALPEEVAAPDMTDPVYLAGIWHTLTQQEQLSAVAALTADQFVSLQELLAVRPRPTPAEEDTLFIPTPKPTAAPTSLPDESESKPATPDFSDPAVLAGIWPALSPEEQLSILSALTPEQYSALQELLVRPPNTGGSMP